MGEWQEIPLKKLTNKIGSGATPRGGSNAYKEEGISLIRSQNVLDLKFSYDGLAFIDDQQAEKLNNVEVCENDVLLNITGDSVARCCLVDKNCLPARVNQHVAIIRVLPEKADHRFILYALQFLKPELLSQSEIGATRRALTKGMIEDFTIYTPETFSQQRAIAKVLFSLDEKIDLLYRQNKTLEAFAEALFRHTFIDNVEDDWEDGKLPDEFDFTMGLSPPGSSYNEDGEGIPMYQGNADFEFRFPRRRVYTTEEKRLAEKYDTLISVRAPVGEQNMAFEKCCIGRGVAAFRYKRNANYYSYTYFKLRSLMDQVKQYNDTGTVFGSINKKDFENLDIIIPPNGLIDEYQGQVKPLDDKVITNCIQIKTLENLRDTLLPKLMSGEVRVQYEEAV
ncbi:MAG: restriction endonuclease subunit S [Alphaproteobacteria bacterium]|jgi:type I restriction enzyme S subunit|nr:restriction endonuclease subunit S [Alphaproteobacteria bacterium]